MTITVYSKPSCQQCVATTRKLTELDISFEHAEAMDPSNLEFIKGLGHMGAPVVTVEDKGIIVDSWSGFRPDKIGELV